MLSFLAAIQRQHRWNKYLEPGTTLEKKKKKALNVATSRPLHEVNRRSASRLAPPLPILVSGRRSASRRGRSVAAVDGERFMMQEKSQAKWMGGIRNRSSAFCLKHWQEVLDDVHFFFFFS